MEKTKIPAAASRTGILTAYFLIFVVWGSTYYFIGAALKGFDLFVMGALRFTAAGFIVLLWSWRRGEQIFRIDLIRTSAASGIVMLFIDMAVVMMAQKYVSSSMAAIVASSTAIWIMVLDIPMWQTNFRNMRQIAAVFIGFAGVMMLYIEQFYFSGSTNKQGHYGILLLVLGCFSWALGTLYTKYMQADYNQNSSFAAAGWQMLSAAAMFWIFASARGEFSKTAWQKVSSEAWFALSYLIFFGSILAYSAYLWLLKIRPASEVASHSYVNPLVAVLIGAAAGKEHISFLQMAGLAAILSSLFLMGAKRRSAG